MHKTNLSLVSEIFIGQGAAEAALLIIGKVGRGLIAPARLSR